MAAGKEEKAGSAKETEQAQKSSRSSRGGRRGGRRRRSAAAQENRVEKNGNDSSTDQQKRSAPPEEKSQQSRSAAPPALEAGKPGASSAGQGEKKTGRRAISESSKSRISAAVEDNGAPVSGKGHTPTSPAREGKESSVTETQELGKGAGPQTGKKEVSGKGREERKAEARESSPREAGVADSGSADAGEAARGEAGGKRTPRPRSRSRTAVPPPRKEGLLHHLSRPFRQRKSLRRLLRRRKRIEALRGHFFKRSLWKSRKGIFCAEKLTQYRREDPGVDGGIIE